jgi:hypothetical protein
MLWLSRNLNGQKESKQQCPGTWLLRLDSGPSRCASLRLAGLHLTRYREILQSIRYSRDLQNAQERFLISGADGIRRLADVAAVRSASSDNRIVFIARFAFLGTVN